jgi:hypothetical protein
MIYRKRYFFSLILFVQLNVLAQSGVYNVMAFGAKGDGISLETEAIQRAVDRCSSEGGGKVYIPAGKYLTGSIILKSNINFYIESGAVITGSPNKDDYEIKIPAFESRTNDLYVNRSSLYAENAENVSVTGGGIINGNGLHKNYSITNPQKNRPFLARFIACRNVTIRDVNMLESANWTLHLLGCEGVLIDGLKIKNSVRANRDGLDIDGCKDVSVSNCRIDSMDDAIVLKSTGPAVTRNVTISNCNVSSHASGIKFGTETTGGFENITISNCAIRDIPVYSGLAFMIVDGGYMKNIIVNNIVMDKVNIPLMIRLGNRARPYKTGKPAPDIGSIENIQISNVIATNAGMTSHITGLHKKRIKNVSLSNINIQYKGKYGGKPLEYNKVPLREADYPSGQLYGKALPASAFYFRNVSGLSLDQIFVSFMEKDSRIPMIFDRIEDLFLTGSHIKTKNPLVYLRNVKNAQIDNCGNYGQSSFLVEMEKDNCSDVVVDPDKFLNSQKAINPVSALPDKNYDDISGFSNISFSKRPEVKGLPAYALKEGSLRADLKSEKGKAIKLYLLSFTDAEDEMITVTINGKDYPLRITNHDWGWNVVSLLQKNNEEKVKVELSSKKGTASSVYISKISLIPVSVTD